MGPLPQLWVPSTPLPTLPLPSLLPPLLLLPWLLPPAASSRPRTSSVTLPTDTRTSTLPSRSVVTHTVVSRDLTLTSTRPEYTLSTMWLMTSDSVLLVTTSPLLPCTMLLLPLLQSTPELPLLLLLTLPRLLRPRLLSTLPTLLRPAELRGPLSSLLESLTLLLMLLWPLLLLLLPPLLPPGKLSSPPSSSTLDTLCSTGWTKQGWTAPLLSSLLKSLIRVLNIVGGERK